MRYNEKVFLILLMGIIIIFFSACSNELSIENKSEKKKLFMQMMELLLSM